MNIIQVSAHYPPNFGGLQNVAKEISERLSKKGHQVKVFTSDIGCPKEKQLKSTKNLKINYLPSWEFAHTPIIPSLFSRLMKIPKDSIIHIHVAQALTPEIVWLISKLRKIPYIAHLHGDVKPSGKMGFLLKPYQKIFFKQVIKNALKIIVLTKEYKNFFKENYNCTQEIIVIPNGVKEEFFINKKRNNNKRINLLYVGRLSPEKNIPNLIEAFSILKNKNLNLNIVGEGEKRQEIENLIKLKKLKNVILHGRKEGKELIEVYKNSDIFLLASNSEGLPLVLLEAMASKTPIIASDVRGIHELIKGVGILVNPPTTKKFAEAIQKLIDNPRLRKKLAENGSKEVKKYSWDKIVSQIEQVYKEVLAEHSKTKK